MTYYEEALRHKSSARIPKSVDNERLEFLGDAILDSIVANYLYEKFPTASEGELTQMKSRIVSRKTLGSLAIKLKMETIVDFIDGKYVNKNTICGNALEAVVGAMYLDKGYTISNQSVLKILQKHLDITTLVQSNEDYKSQVLVWAQKNKKYLQFKMVHEEDLGHEKKYIYHVLCEGELCGMGEGSSKKRAEQAASQAALNKLT